MLADFPSQLNQAAVQKKIFEKLYLLGNFDNLQTFQVYWQIAKLLATPLDQGRLSSKTLQNIARTFKRLCINLKDFARS